MPEETPIEGSPKLRGRERYARRREVLRERLWPGSSVAVWSRKSNDGFTTIPRLLPLVMSLIKTLAPKGDPSAVYFELWCRAFDEGIITISDEDAHAYSAGYTGSRAVRTWRERILTLSDLGLIKVKPHGNREIGHILLLDPLKVCVRLYRTRPDAIPEGWWGAFVARAGEIGAELQEIPQSDA